MLGRLWIIFFILDYGLVKPPKVFKLFLDSDYTAKNTKVFGNFLILNFTKSQKRI